MRYLYYIQNELVLIIIQSVMKNTIRKIIFLNSILQRRKNEVHDFFLNYIKKPYDQVNPLYRTGVLVGDYPVDHHHDAHPNKKGYHSSFYPIPSYTLPIGSIISKNEFFGCRKSISVSNLVNGTQDFNPVLQIGQIAGLIASEAVIKYKYTTNRH